MKAKIGIGMFILMSSVLAQADENWTHITSNIEDLQVVVGGVRVPTDACKCPTPIAYFGSDQLVEGLLSSPDNEHVSIQTVVKVGTGSVLIKSKNIK